MSGSVETSDIVALYGLEAGLIQQKATHVLAIRTLAVSVFAAVVGAAILYPGRGIQFLSLILLPFYVLDAVYDGYLIPIVRRETKLRLELSRRMAASGLDTDLVSAFESNPDHRFAPADWSPFRRAMVEPIRVFLYASLTLAPILAVHFLSGLG